MEKPSLHQILSEKKAIIFDLYHTLTATEITSPQGLSTATILGIDRRLWNQHFMDRSRDRLTGNTNDAYTVIKDLAHAIDPSIPEELIRQAVEHRARRFEESLELMPEASIETIRYLKSKGKKVALLSNADVIETRGWVKCPAGPYFDATIFSCEVGYMKPDIEIYKLCLDRLGVEARDSVFVGDGGSNELYAARSMGITTIMVTGIARMIWPEKLAAIEEDADYVIESVSELINNI
jgi:putative hydrolase of the HAD superfamily